MCFLMGRDMLLCIRLYFYFKISKELNLIILGNDHPNNDNNKNNQVKRKADTKNF